MSSTGEWRPTSRKEAAEKYADGAVATEEYFERGERKDLVYRLPNGTYELDSALGKRFPTAAAAKLMREFR